MAKEHIYKFRIDGFTPQTMPFGRLVEYYGQIQKMLGDHIHLIEVHEGSHMSRFRIERGHEAAIASTLSDVKVGKAAAPIMSANEKINMMLAEDKTQGAFLDELDRDAIVFHGHCASKSEALRVSDTAVIVGKLYHLAGSGETAKIRLNTDEYGTVLGACSISLGRDLRQFLFEKVRLIGRGTWVRQGFGEWKLEEFSVAHFEPVSAHTLKEAVTRLRSIEVDWPDDPLGDIRSLNEGNG
ncbi:MAG: hypothetical protein Alpg2KO_20540 [Alphaproteobacteria bacterium]